MPTRGTVKATRIPADVIEALATGAYIGDRSRTAYRVLAELIRAGTTETEFLDAVEHDPAFAGYAVLRGGKAATIVAAARAEWRRISTKVSPQVVWGRTALTLSEDVGRWLGAAYEVIDAIEATSVVTMGTAARLTALVEGLTRIAGLKGTMSFHNPDRGVAMLAGLSRNTLRDLRKVLIGHGLLAVTTNGAPKVKKVTLDDGDVTAWELLVPDGCSATVPTVPVLEPAWAALGWDLRRVWLTVQRVDDLAELDAVLGVDRRTRTAKLHALAEAGLYLPRSRRLGEVRHLRDLTDEDYAVLVAPWDDRVAELRADGWAAKRARFWESHAADGGEEVAAYRAAEAATHEVVEAEEVALLSWRHRNPVEWLLGVRPMGAELITDELLEARAKRERAVAAHGAQRAA